ncbi:hypothetical protein FALBO_4966 [Fusarium albosuccineum]|uniref:Uncharacterized protein n=1 Tax=Fusarium albosuccineum TaxID=1237068 RepID=A0A8H4LI97_9HYPO|nr:hypothetical protein FALBO_4966 [Fusarium albosuccineum]
MGGATTPGDFINSISSTFPNDAKSAVQSLVNILGNTDIFNPNSLGVLAGVLGATAGVTFATTTEIIIETLSELIFITEFARGFSLFTAGNSDQGTQVMKGVSQAANQYYQETGELAPGTPNPRVTLILGSFNAVLKFVATWVPMEKIFQQNAAMKFNEQKATIHDTFCQRFSLRMQSDQFRAVQNLYDQLDTLMEVNQQFASEPDMGPEMRQQALPIIVNGAIYGYQGDMGRINDNVVYEECNTYDTADPSTWPIEDPSLSDVQSWLNEPANQPSNGTATS